MTIIIAILGLLAVLYAVLLAALYVFQRRLMFLPDTNVPDRIRAGLPYVEIVRVPTEDGLSLLAWFAPPRVADGHIVLFLHGNAGNIGHRADRLRRLRALGWGVLLLEYRGYGGNPGSPTEAGLLLDASAALAWLHRHEIRPGQVLLWGESLGTALAVCLAAENDVAALLLEAPFTSVTDVARRQYSYAPVRPLLKDRFDSRARIARVKAPILVMHGSRDRLVPLSMAQALLDAAPASHELWVAAEAGHVDLTPFGAIEAASAFVAQYCGRARP